MATYTVFGTVTVSCYMKVEADSAEEALALVKNGEVEEEWDTDKDGEPEWTTARDTGGNREG